MENSSTQLDARVARLETRVEHVESTTSRSLTDVKDFRSSVEAKFDRVNERFSTLQASMDEKFERVNERISNLHASMNEKFGEIKVWALTILGGGLGFGILSIVARAHWI